MESTDDWDRGGPSPSHPVGYSQVGVCPAYTTCPGVRPTVPGLFPALRRLVVRPILASPGSHLVGNPAVLPGWHPCSLPRTGVHSGQSDCRGHTMLSNCSRRRWLQWIGHSGLGVALTPWDWLTPHLRAATRPVKNSVASARPGRSCWSTPAAGQSQLDTWDPKPDAPRRNPRRVRLHRHRRARHSRLRTHAAPGPPRQPLYARPQRVP